MPEIRSRILIVDDREETRYVLSRVLERAGYDCEEASTGHAALAKAETLPAVVILDVHLPDMSGYDVCRQIKNNPETAQLSVLQISASFISNEDKARALEAGADAHLTHPIDGIVLVATVRSLLRLRAAELLARESAAQWQSTFDALSEGLAFVNAEGRVARFNRAFAEISGLERAKTGVLAADVLDRLLGSSEALRHEGATRYITEFAVAQKKVQLSVDRVKTEDGEIGKVLVLTDVTDRRLAEYALRTAEKLAATGKLANAIAHEINNPLEALINLIYLGRVSTSLEDIHQLLGGAQQEIERIGRITKQSLSFHRDTQHAVPVDIGSLIKEVVALYSNVATARRVQLVCDREPAAEIYGFPGQLRQVFANLIRNAAEAAPANSKVVIRVKPVRRGDRKGTRVTIHDSGVGIPKSIQEQMFDPFFTTKELKGSGLGLWVSKALIVKHRGSIRFRSRTRDGSSGTTFQVFLPVEGLDSVALSNELE